MNKANEKPPLIIITGPTAVGKTSLSLDLAQQLNGEIISADSMQVYKHMDIGTAKISKQEQRGIPHHLIDILEPEQSFHVASFQSSAKDVLQDLYKRGKTPIVVGGTGFYIQALLYDIDFSKGEEDLAYRLELKKMEQEVGVVALHEHLRKKDPRSAEVIHPNNVKKVIRALEYWKQTGQSITTHNEEQRRRESPYSFRYFVLTDERSILYHNIDRRVDEMLAQGLVEEVKTLMERGLDERYQSMQGLGYKEILEYLHGKCNLEEAVYRLKRDTRHFAKRQLTWFRREKEVIWVDKSHYRTDPTHVQSIDYPKMLRDIQNHI